MAFCGYTANIHLKLKVGGVLLTSSLHSQDSKIFEPPLTAHLDLMMEGTITKLHCNAPYLMAFSPDAL